MAGALRLKRASLGLLPGLGGSGRAPATADRDGAHEEPSRSRMRFTRPGQQAPPSRAVVGSAEEHAAQALTAPLI